jgi:hypothetical protein
MFLAHVNTLTHLTFTSCFNLFQFLLSPTVLLQLSLPLPTSIFHYQSNHRLSHFPFLLPTSTSQYHFTLLLLTFNLHFHFSLSLHTSISYFKFSLPLLTYISNFYFSLRILISSSTSDTHFPFLFPTSMYFPVPFYITLSHFSLRSSLPLLTSSSHFLFSLPLLTSTSNFHFSLPLLIFPPTSVTHFRFPHNVPLPLPRLQTFH